MPRGGGGTGMPTEAWMFACGFRTVIGKLLELTLPQPVEKAGWSEGDPVADKPTYGNCKVLLCAGTIVEFDVDFHTAIIGLQPAGLVTANKADSALYHVGELVQVNLGARSNIALSIERYFTNVSRAASTDE